MIIGGPVLLPHTDLDCAVTGDGGARVSDDRYEIGSAVNGDFIDAQRYDVEAAHGLL